MSGVTFVRFRADLPWTRVDTVNTISVHSSTVDGNTTWFLDVNASAYIMADEATAREALERFIDAVGHVDLSE